MEDKNYSNEEFESLLCNYDYKFKRGDLVTGIVLGYEADNVLVDIGAKSVAIVPPKEASVDYDAKLHDVLEKNKEYEFLIISDVDENGQFYLSHKKVDLVYSWKELEKLKNTDEVINGQIVQIVKGGILVDIIGIRGFVPSSQIQERETKYAVGDKIELKILSLDEDQNNLVLSNKKVYNDSLESAKQVVFGQVEVGQIVKGKVVRIASFGAFVDVGGVDCLLPLSQISWKWVEHPTDLLKIGETIEVAIFDIDREKERITLSLKNITDDPWVEVAKNIKEGDIREGFVTRIKSFGAFVEVYPGVEALLPHDEVIEYQNSKNEILEVGAKLDVKVIKFNPEDKRISLAIISKEFQVEK